MSSAACISSSPDGPFSVLLRRSFEENLAYIRREDPVASPFVYTIDVGFVPNMRVPGRLFMCDSFARNLFDELRQFLDSAGTSFPPALLQVANVASLPGIVDASVGLPDIHSGYGFAIGNMAAFDLDNPEAIVSPGGVGFDINCGVRMLRTNLTTQDLEAVKEQLCDELFSLIPVGVGTKSHLAIPGTAMNALMERGMPWAVENGLAWPEDVGVTERGGFLPGANARKISNKARGRSNQLGTLGSGNHYVEVQAVEEIFDADAAKAMGITKRGQVCIMIHCGSRGFGHQIASDYVNQMLEMSQSLNDPQLACVPAGSPLGKEYLSCMAAAANFAFVNRSAIATQVRTAFERVLGRSARELNMHQVYDVAHNIATVEEHVVHGKVRSLLVHRKGSTRAFPPGHPELPDIYQKCGQPVLIGGSMGTWSFVMTGTQRAMEVSFGSTCHGAGRALSRSSSRKALAPEEVLERLKAQGIAIRVASPDHISEEAPESYKDVCDVVDVCDAVGISKKAFKLRPIAVIKG